MRIAICAILVMFRIGHNSTSEKFEHLALRVATIESRPQTDAELDAERLQWKARAKAAELRLDNATKKQLNGR